MKTLIHTLVLMAGVGQVVLSICSIAIPKLLSWGSELSKVRPLIKQIFWTYAVYILCFNFSFGLISIFGADELLSGSGLAKAVTGFIAVYWIGRVFTQFFYFDRTDFPKGKWYTAGEAALVCLFVSLAITYGLACYFNFQ